MRPAANALFTSYEAQCSQEGCPGRLKFDESQSAGLAPGKIIPFTSANPAYGRCPICLRHKMTVTKGPPPPEPAPLKGFSKIPKE